MKLYEYELKTSRIIMTSYEVKETEKSFTVQKISGRKNFIGYNCYTRIPKELIGAVLCYANSEIYYLSLNNDIEEASKALLDFLQNKKLPAIEAKIKSLLNDKELYCDIAEMLKKGEMEVTNNEL